MICTCVCVVARGHLQSVAQLTLPVRREMVVIELVEPKCSHFVDRRVCGVDAMWWYLCGSAGIICANILTPRRNLLRCEISAIGVKAFKP